MNIIRIGRTCTPAERFQVYTVGEMGTKVDGLCPLQVNKLLNTSSPAPVAPISGQIFHAEFSKWVGGGVQGSVVFCKRIQQFREYYRALLPLASVFTFK